MRNKFLLFSLILIIFTSVLNVFVYAEEKSEMPARIVVASVSFSKVKTKQDVKDLSKDILDDYSDVFKLAKDYTSDFKKFKKYINSFLVELEEDYEARCEDKQDEIDALNKKIKSNTKKYNRAVDSSDKKDIDYYKSLITEDNNTINELEQMMEEDREVYNAVKSEVEGQLKDAKKANRSIKKNKDSSTKVNKRFSRLSNNFVSRNGKKTSLKKVVDSAMSLNQRLFMLETKCRKQIQYFDDYYAEDVE